MNDWQSNSSFIELNKKTKIHNKLSLFWIKNKRAWWYTEKLRKIIALPNRVRQMDKEI